MLQERPKTREELEYEKALKTGLENWMKGTVAEGMEGLDKYHEGKFGYKFDLAAEVQKETENRNAKVNTTDERE